MERVVEPIDKNHNRMVFIMQSPTERDQYLKTFFHPMPSTHYLKWEWNPELTRLIFEPATAPNLPAPATTAPSPLAGAEAFWSVADNDLYDLLTGNSTAVEALPDFAKPTSRADAVTLLVRAGIKPTPNSPNVTTTPAPPNSPTIPPVSPLASPASTTTPASPDRAALIATLNALDDVALETYATEREVTLGKKWGKPQIIAAIADKLAPVAKPGA